MVTRTRRKLQRVILGRNNIDTFWSNQKEFSVNTIFTNTVLLLRGSRLGFTEEQYAQFKRDLMDDDESVVFSNCQPVHFYTGEAVRKGVAYLSPRAINSRDGRDRINSFVQTYAKSIGVGLDKLANELDVYVFGGDCFAIQTQLNPSGRGSVRVKFNLNNGGVLTDYLEKNIGVNVICPELSVPEDIMDGLSAIADGSLDIKQFSRHPAGLSKKLTIYSNGSFKYRINNKVKQPDTSWDLTSVEYDLQFNEDC